MCTGGRLSGIVGWGWGSALAMCLFCLLGTGMTCVALFYPLRMRKRGTSIGCQGQEVFFFATQQFPHNARI